MPKPTLLIIAIAGWAGAVGLFLFRKPVSDPVSAPAASVEVPAGKALPRLQGEIDFSGTGLADETWNLGGSGAESPPEGKIPDKIPEPSVDGESPAAGLGGESLPKAPPSGAEWNPGTSLKLDIRPGPAVE